MKKSKDKNTLRKIQKKTFIAVSFVALSLAVLCVITEIPLHQVGDIIIKDLTPKGFKEGYTAINDVAEKYGKNGKNKLTNILSDNSLNVLKDNNIQNVGIFKKLKNNKKFILEIDEKETVINLNGIEISKKYSDAIETALKQMPVLYIEYEDNLTDNADSIVGYLYFTDGTMVQKWLLEKGYAEFSEKSNSRYKDELIDIENKAKENKIGLWENND